MCLLYSSKDSNLKVEKSCIHENDKNFSDKQNSIPVGHFICLTLRVGKSPKTIRTESDQHFFEGWKVSDIFSKGWKMSDTFLFRVENCLTDFLNYKPDLKLKTMPNPVKPRA